MPHGLTHDDISDLAHIAAELGHERGEEFDPEAAVIRLGKAAQIDEPFMLEARALAHSIRLRMHVRSSSNMRGLKPLTPRLARIEQDAATILKVAAKSPAPKGNRRKR
jgi:hypothetical protein